MAVADKGPGRGCSDCYGRMLPATRQVDREGSTIPAEAMVWVCVQCGKVIWGHTPLEGNRMILRWAQEYVRIYSD